MAPSSDFWFLVVENSQAGDAGEVPLVRGQDGCVVVQGGAGDEEIHRRELSTLLDQAPMDAGVRLGEAVVWRHEGKLSARLPDPPAFPGGLRVQLCAHEQLTKHEDADRQRLGPVRGEPSPGGTLLVAARLPHGIDQKCRVQVDHHRGTRTG